MTEPVNTQAELEAFRREWQQEVSARTAGSGRRNNDGVSNVRAGGARDDGPASKTVPQQAQQEASPYTYHDLPNREDNLRLDAAENGLDRNVQRSEPRSALEHYEQAVEQETAGRLGDSLRLYRQAFKLDDGVHEKYKAKHFPPSSFPTRPPPAAAANATTSASASSKLAPQKALSTISHLIESFANLAIPPLEPPTSASPQPPCPVADLPDEILTTVLRHVAHTNIATFAKLAVVCKRFAYLTMTEDSIWRAVVFGRLQGFGDMHYRYTCDIFGKTLEQHDAHEDDTLIYDTSSLVFADVSQRLLRAQYSDSWRQMFRSRPRIRFHGVYISTVNYTRPGGASATINTWSTPVHVVTYYRYLRFFRDGTVISLLTVSEPIDVVHILTKDRLSEQATDPRQHRRTHHLDKAQTSKPPPSVLATASSSSGPQHAHHTEPVHALPSSQIMKDALRGRWRLSGPGSGADNDIVTSDVEGDVHIETEGVVPKYIYRMQFAIGSSSAGTAANAAAQTGQNIGGKRGSRNNRLTWKGFWSYNRLTDDWGEFGLKNDKAFYFSRVKSYGNGG